MAVLRFPTGEGTTTNVYLPEGCEQVNPFSYYIEKYGTFRYEHLVVHYSKELSTASFWERQVLLNRLKALAADEIHAKNLIARDTVLQPELVQLLVEKKKKQQQKLIKNIKLSADDLYALPLFAWNKHRMPYSGFAVDYLPKEFDEKVLPAYIRKNDDGKIEYQGPTDMTENEMEVALRKRNRVVTEFIGDNISWLCFFRTTSGIRGLEEPHIGQPHLHFISSAWGISREAIVRQLSSYRYNINAETIPFLRLEVGDSDESSL